MVSSSRLWNRGKISHYNQILVAKTFSSQRVMLEKQNVFYLLLLKIKFEAIF